MNKNTRWALAILGLAILVAAAVFISTSDDSTPATEQNQPTPATVDPDSGSTGSTGSTSTGGATGGGNDTGGATSGGSAPDNGTGGAKPDDNGTGGAKVSSEQGPLLTAAKVTKISVDKGDIVYVRARSAQADELHIHGYDYTVDLPAGKTVTYKFKADIGGAFEMEFENQGIQVAALKVNP